MPKKSAPQARREADTPVNAHFTGVVLGNIRDRLGAPSLIVRLEEDGRYSLFWKVDGMEYSATGDTLPQVFATALELVGK